MQSFRMKKGATSKRIPVFVQDSTLAATTGAGLAGLVYNSAGLTCYYWREDEGNAGATAVTLATATRGTFTSSGFIEKDATNQPGMYEFGVPNAAIASGAEWVEFLFKGATSMVATVVRIYLEAIDVQDTVRLGLTAIPNVASGSDGSVMVRGATQDITLKSLAVSNSAGDAVTLTSSGSNGNGLNLVANGSGSGMLATGGATGHGISGVGGATSGNGIKSTGTAGNSAALNLVGQGSAAGLLTTGGATGQGILTVGGATSGDGLRVVGTAGNSPAINLVGQGSAAGLLSTGGATGQGASFVGGATSGAGVKIAAAAGNSIGLDIDGFGSAAGLDATGGATGNGVLLTGGATSGAGFRVVGTAGNSAGVEFVGQGSANGFTVTAGATGNGVVFNGGATSGDGFRCVATSGDGAEFTTSGGGSDFNATTATTDMQAFADQILIRPTTTIEASIAKLSLGDLIHTVTNSSFSSTTQTVKKADASTLFTHTLTVASPGTVNAITGIAT